MSSRLHATLYGRKWVLENQIKSPSSLLLAFPSIWNPRHKVGTSISGSKISTCKPELERYDAHSLFFFFKYKSMMSKLQYSIVGIINKNNPQHEMPILFDICH